MSRLRLVFVLSLVILAGVFMATIYFIPVGQSYPESRKAQIIQGEDEWILQYDIINNEERDIKYTIYITVDDVVYRDSTVVRPGKSYTYIHHIYPAQLEKGELTFALYEEGKVMPLEQVTYYIDLDSR